MKIYWTFQNYLLKYNFQIPIQQLTPDQGKHLIMQLNQQAYNKCDINILVPKIPCLHHNTRYTDWLQFCCDLGMWNQRIEKVVPSLSQSSKTWWDNTGLSVLASYLSFTDIDYLISKYSYSKRLQKYNTIAEYGSRSNTQLFIQINTQILNVRSKYWDLRHQSHS